MKSRLISNSGNPLLLCNDGTISLVTNQLAAHFISHFHDVNIFTGSDGKWTSSTLDMSQYPGETLAYVTDGGELVITDPWLIEYAFIQNRLDEEPKYLSLLEYAHKHNRSKEMIKSLIRNKRIMGAFRVGNQWLIPEDAPYPIEDRMRKPTSGRTARKP